MEQQSLSLYLISPPEKLIRINITKLKNPSHLFQGVRKNPKINTEE